MNAVASRFCTGVKNRIADAGRLTKKDLILTNDAESKCVDERIKAVRFVKNNLAADRRHAKTVAVMPDAVDAAF